MANATEAFPTLRADANGTLTELAAIPAGIDAQNFLMCTTVAIHRPSRTAYCSYAQSELGTLGTIDLRDPANSRIVNREALRDPRLRVRRSLVVGDTLYLAAFDSGLLAATIRPDGTPVDLRPTPITGDVRFIDGDASRLVVLDHAVGLRVVRTGTPVWTSSTPLALEGPRLGLRVVGDSALASLGSEGLALVDLTSDPPRETLRLRPPGVVTSADRDGDLVAVACTSGVFLYDLGGPTPRLRGWHPAQSIVLDVRFYGRDLLVADWATVARLGVDRNRELQAVEVGWGQFIGAAAATLSLRNLGETPQSIAVRTASSQTGRLRLGPVETRVLPIDLDSFPNFGGRINVDVLQLDASGRECARRRAAFARSMGAIPGVGDAMPPLVLAITPTTTLRLPLAAEKTRLVFYSHDCAAMWPQVEDLAYLARAGRLPDQATPILVAREYEARFGFARRFGLEGVRRVFYGSPFDDTPDEVRASVAPYGRDLYYDSFQLTMLLSGAAHPTDYFIGTDGRVNATERIYRGAYPLR